MYKTHTKYYLFIVYFLNGEIVFLYLFLIASVYISLFSFSSNKLQLSFVTKVDLT